MNNDDINIVLLDNFNGSTSILGHGKYFKLENGMMLFTEGDSKTTYWTYTNDSFNYFTCSVNAKSTGKNNDYGYGISFGGSENGKSIFEFDIK